MSINVGELVATMRLDDAAYTNAMRQAPAEAARGMAGVTGAIGSAAGSTSGLWQDAAGKWRNSTGQFASAVERQMAGIPAAAGQAGTQAGQALGRGARSGVEESRGFFSRLGHDIGGEFMDGVKKMIAAAGIIAGGKALLGFFKESIDAASSAGETMSKAGIIFGSNFGKIEAWSKTAATSMGLSSTAAVGAATSFGDMFSQIGFAADAAADMSTSTVQLAADLGSFNDLETGDVLDRISGALRGEYDSLQAIIPNINGTRVEHEALAASGKKTASELTAAERATATLAIVTADGARAVGDFARTADSASNTSKTLAAQFEELQVSVGNKLMPAWQAFQELLSVGIGILGGMVEVIADVVSWFSQLPGPVQAGAAAFALWVTVGPQVVGFLKGLMFVIPMIMSSLGGMAGGMRAVGAAMLTSFGGPIGIAILGVTAAIGIFMSKTEAAQTTVSNFAGVIDEATGKLAANADEVLRNGAAESGHLQAYKAMGGVVTDYTGALKGLGPEQDRVHTAILDAAEAALTGSGAWSRMVAKGIELSGNSRQVASDILASGDAGQYASGQFDAVLGVSGNLASDMGLVADESGKAAVKLEDAAGGAGKAGDAAADAGDPMKNLADATKALGGAASDADTATQFLIASLIAVNGGTVTAQQAADLAAAAFRGIAQSQRDNSAAHDGVTAAALKVTDAEAKLADVTAHLGDENTDTRTTAEQVTAAQLDLADAHRGVDDAAAEVTQSEEDMRTANIKARDAAIANASSAFTLAGGYDNVQASSNAANQKIEEARTAFINAQPEADRLSGKAAAVAQSLFGIPGETVARMREAGGDGVIGTADDVKQAVNQIPGSHNTDITVSGGAQEVANNIRRAIELIPGYKQLVIESKLVGAPIPLPHLGGGFRRGGATPDTGPYTVDNQPIIAHRGEHVLDGNDVNKLGGQAGTYGFRDALTAGGAQAAAMWLLQRNGGLPGAMAPAGSAVTAQANTGPRTVIQFGDVRVGEYRDATDLLNRAAYMGVN